MSLRDELAAILNMHCAENNSNTPDYVLAQFIGDSLDAFDRAVNARELHYGRVIVRTSAPPFAGVGPNYISQERFENGDLEDAQKQSNHRADAIAGAIAYWKRWPDSLPSGVMFYQGERITRAEFESSSRNGGG